MERHLGGNVKYSVGVARAKCQGICLNWIMCFISQEHHFNFKVLFYAKAFPFMAKSTL